MSGGVDQEDSPSPPVKVAGDDWEHRIKAPEGRTHAISGAAEELAVCNALIDEIQAN